MTYWLDSSALVKRYIDETGSAWVEGLFADNRVAVAAIAAVELVSALTRRANRGDIAAEDLELALRAWRADADQYFVVAVDPLLAPAESLAARHGLRANDAIQLAGALEARGRLQAAGLPGPIFAASDRQLLAAAQAEGFEVEDPVRYS